LQKKAPNALKSLDAELKSAPLPDWPHRAEANAPQRGRKFSWLQGVEKPRNADGISLRAGVTQSRGSVWVVMARSEATKQPSGRVTRPLGCFAPLAMTM
jgi:hypothetical protein